MAKQSSGNVIGGWAFLIGVILAVVLGFVEQSPTLSMILLLVGLVIGLLNVADKEVGPFLISGAVLIIASSFNGEALEVIPALDKIFSALLAVFVPATIVVAIKNVFSLANR